MVVDKFNMVDMGGIDIIMAQGLEVEGLYDRLISAIAACRYQCLYNWKFDGIIIPPAYVELEVNEEDEVVINGGINVGDDDVIRIYSISRLPVIEALIADHNGIYSTEEGVDGFRPVTVQVPITELNVNANGTYTAESGGYSPVSVNVPPPVKEELHAEANGTYTSENGFSPVIVDVPSGGEVQPPIPSEYQQVEYLDYTPSVGILVDVPVTIQEINYRAVLIEVKFTNDKSSGSSDAVGYRGSTTYGTDFEMRVNNLKSDFFIRNSDSAVALSRVGNTIQIGQEITMIAAFRNASEHFLIGRYAYYNGNNTTALDGKVFYVKVINPQREVICWYVPCYRKADNVVGWYDAARSQFYYTQYAPDSSYDNTITAGPDVN